MAQWRCRICNYIYDENVGDIHNKVKPGTLFSDLPDGWVCPVCHADKEAFELLAGASEPGEMGKTVSDAIVAGLVSFGIFEFFGVPGTSSLGIIDAIRKNPQAHFTLFRHEENAAMAASAYNKLTGNIAVCVTIAGPGATNLATGLYDAKEDHASVISLNGQVEMQYTGPGGFQEIDQDAFFRPLTVYNNTISDPSVAMKILTLAIRHAIIRSGVAQISIPNDVQKKPIPKEYSLPDGVISSLKISPEPEKIKESIQSINDSTNPVIIAGFGALRYAEQVETFANTIDAPVLSTFRAKEMFPEDHPYYAGILGTVGSSQARSLVESADLLITIGVGFSKMTQIPLDLPIIQIDRDPLKLGRGNRCQPIYGDAGCVLDLMRTGLLKNEGKSAVKKVREMKEIWNAKRDEESDPDAVPLRPPYIMNILSEEIPPNAIISIDVGENGWWFGRNFRMKNQRFIMSGYLATMGFGFPGAIAAKIAEPSVPVFCITGDGGFAMAMADFVTAVKYHLPIIVVLLNNHELGMIRVEQEIEQYPNFATDLKNPDFVAYARACGGEGISVGTPDELVPAVRWALNQDCPVILDILTDPKRF